MRAATMVPKLLAACPSVSTTWASHLLYWNNEPRGEFTDLSVFAHHVVKNYTEGKTSEFLAFFETLEMFLSSGDEQVVGLTKYALVEDIQNIASHQPFGHQVFKSWCLAKTKLAWEAVAQEWENNSSLAQVLRSEHGTKP